MLAGRALGASLRCRLGCLLLGDYHDDCVDVGRFDVCFDDVCKL